MQQSIYYTIIMLFGSVYKSFYKKSLKIGKNPLLNGKRCVIIFLKRTFVYGFYIFSL